MKSLELIIEVQMLRKRRWQSPSQSSEQEKQKNNWRSSHKIDKEQDALLKQAVKVEFRQEIPMGTLEKCVTTYESVHSMLSGP